MKTRKELIDYIYNHSKEEFTTMYEVFQLAKETKKQLRERVKSIQEYYEYEEDIQKFR